MKKYGFILLLLTACAHQSNNELLSVMPEGELSLIVHIDQIQCCEGVLRLAVYNDASYWMSDQGMVRGRIGFIQGEQQDIEIHGLPEGRYAVAVHQDIDGDGKFDRLFGILPREPYGFSNDAGKYGPASFSQASFVLTKDKTITVKLNSL